MAQNTLSALVLAAGKGTRMKSDKAKVLHEVFFAPMVHHVLHAIKPLEFEKTVVVVGHQRVEVEDSLAGFSVEFASQEEQLGTGHAVLMARELLAPLGGMVLILCGDTPLIKSETLQHILEEHQKSGTILTVMTTELFDSTHYGRILKDADGLVCGIVEEKDANAEQLEIKEINAGIYVVSVDYLFDALERVGADNVQGEVYLTDIVEIARRDGRAVAAFQCADPEEILGVNSRVELAMANARLNERQNINLMSNGVTLVRPETISIEKGVLLGQDTVVEENVRITGRSVIGKNCHIGSGCRIHDCHISEGSRLGPYCILADSTISAGDSIEPFAVIAK